MKRVKLYHVVILLVLIFLLLYLIPFTRQMNDSYLCEVLDQEDESYSDQVTVTFSGTYKDYFFRKDIFIGRIDIEGYNFMSPRAEDIELTIGKFQFSHIIEFVPIYSNFKGLGSFHGEEDFENFFLWLLVPDEEDPNTSHGRYFLTYPEMSMEEIENILQNS